MHAIDGFHHPRHHLQLLPLCPFLHSVRGIKFGCGASRSRGAGQPAVQAHQHSDDEIPHPGKHGEEGESEKQCYCCGSFTFAHHLAG